MDLRPWAYRPHNGKRAVFVLNIGPFWPQLTAITFPNLRSYADKIKAEFIEIRERQFPDFPVTYEKLQIHTLGMGNEWNILIDADCMLHPLMPDMTKLLPPDTVGVDYGYNIYNGIRDRNSPNETRLDGRDKYFLRHGSSLGVAMALAVTNDLTHDFWTPLEFGWEEAQKHVSRKHIVDEYCCSRNLARFGLKYRQILDREQSVRDEYIVHLGVEGKGENDRQAVLDRAKTLAQSWGMLD